MGKQRRKKRQARQRKKQSTRRAAGSAYRTIGERGELVACYVNEGWRENGMATVFVLRRIPNGALAMTSFLIDVWCMGLKDAWGRLDMTMAEFEDIVDSPRGFKFEEIDFETARQLIAGSIRFARENGFRRPRRYDRWVMLAGIFGDHAEADLKHFRRDGNLVYVGPIEDLRRRLIGASVEEFLERDDVRFAVGMEDGRGVTNSQALIAEMQERGEEGDGCADEFEGFDVDDTETTDSAGEEIEEQLEENRTQIMAGIRRWCRTRGIKPHPMLEQAWDVHELAIPTVSEHPSPVELSTMRRSVEALVEMRPPQEREQLTAAVEQIKRFVSDFESMHEMNAAIADPSTGGATDEPRDATR